MVTEYAILCHKRGFWGGNLVWWRPNRCGYTSVIDFAGRYTAAEAADITSHGTSTDNQAIPFADALAVSRRVVPAEFLFEKLGGRKPEPPRPTKEVCRCYDCGRFRSLSQMGPESICNECWRGR